MNECPACKKRGKTWNGSDPTCAFKFGYFNTDNWSCATMGMLRAIAENTEIYNNDEHMSVIPFEDGFLVLEWYKRRGRTEAAKVFDFGGTVHDLTLEEAEQILKEKSE